MVKLNEGAHSTKHVDGGSDELTTQLDPGTTNSNGVITLFPDCYDSIGQGTWTYGIQSAQIRNGVFKNTTKADGDNLTMKAFLSQGTYSLRFLYYLAVDNGVVDIDIDGVEVASADLYSSTAGYNRADTTTGIAIATSGLKDIKIRLDGKHGASSAYAAPISFIQLWRTA